MQPLLIKRFNEARKKIREVRGEECSYPVLGFHGTKEENIESICETGFRVPGEKSFQHASDPGIFINLHFNLDFAAEHSKIKACKNHAAKCRVFSNFLAKDNVIFFQCV